MATLLPKGKEGRQIRIDWLKENRGVWDSANLYSNDTLPIFRAMQRAGLYSLKTVPIDADITGLCMSILRAEAGHP